MSEFGGLIHRNGGQWCGERRPEHGKGVSHDLPAQLLIGGQIARSLRFIGWTVVQAEKRSRIGRNRISRWIGGVPPEPAFVQWLDRLVKWHKAWSSPLLPPIGHSGNRPPMKAYEYYKALLIIGWSERVAIGHMGHNRTVMRLSLSRGGALTETESRWLSYLELGHLTYPAPETSLLRTN